MLITALFALALVPRLDDETQRLLPPVLARVDGEEATLAQYQQWLLETQGAALLSQYLDERMLLKAAKNRGCAISDAELDAAFQTEWNTVVKLRFHGDEAAFLEELRTAGHSRDTYAANRKHAILAETTLDRICARERDLSDAAITDRFKSDYGSPPTLFEVHVIQISKYTLEQDRVRRGEARAAGTSEMDTNAEKLARELWTKIDKGGDLGALAKEFSHDAASAAQNGRIAHLTSARLGTAVFAAASALTPEHRLAPLIKDGTGYTIVKLEKKQPVTLDDVRDAVRQAILDDPISGTERGEALAKLRSSAKLERLFEP